MRRRPRPGRRLMRRPRRMELNPTAEWRQPGNGGDKGVSRAFPASFAALSSPSPHSRGNRRAFVGKSPGGVRRLVRIGPKTSNTSPAGHPAGTPSFVAAVPAAGRTLPAGAERHAARTHPLRRRRSRGRQDPPRRTGAPRRPNPPPSSPPFPRQAGPSPPERSATPPEPTPFVAAVPATGRTVRARAERHAAVPRPARPRSPDLSGSPDAPNLSCPVVVLRPLARTDSRTV
jgi:hypothetical protein